jgi:hypothetical protein
MSRTKAKIQLPSKEQLTALGDASMQATACLRNVLRGLDGIQGSNTSDKTLIALLKKDIQYALEPWEAEHD